MAQTTGLTQAVQEYLEALYWLGEAGIDRAQLVTTTRPSMPACSVQV